MKSYCSVCNTVHDTDVKCFDGAGQIARDQGMRSAKGPQHDSKNSNMELAKMLLIMVAAAVIIIYLGWLISQ